MENAASDKNFCLQRTADGELKLKPDHHYYYQVDLECLIKLYMHTITLVMFCYIGSSPTILYRIILLRLHCVYQRGTACRAYQTRHFIYGRKVGESETFF